MAEPTPPTPEVPDVPSVPNEAGPIHEPGTEKFVHPLDLLDQKETAEIEKVIQETQQPPAEPPKEEPPKEEPPKEEPPTEKPGGFGEKPPVEAKPAEKGRPTPRWKHIREANKARAAAEAKAQEEAQRAADLQAQLDAERLKQVDQWGEPLEPIDDPLTKVNKQLETLTERLARQDAELAKQREADQKRAQLDEVRNKVLRDEEAFKQQRPDYTQALEFLIESRRQEYEDMGVIDVGAEQWLVQHEDVVKRHALETGKDPADDSQLYDAARDLTFRLLIDRDRQALLEGSRALNTTVPERAYLLAERRGYKSQASAITSPTNNAETKAQERVRAAVQAQATSQSLSALQNGAAPRSREIKTREDVLKLTDKEIAELDQRQPGWDRTIFGG